MVRLYVVPPMTYGKGMCKCPTMKGGYSPLLVQPAPTALSGSGMKSPPDMRKVRSVLSTLQTTNPRKKYISI